MLEYLAPRGFYFLCSLRSRSAWCVFSHVLISTCSNTSHREGFISNARCARASYAAHLRLLLRAHARSAMRVSLRARRSRSERAACCAFALACASMRSHTRAGKHFVRCASCARAPRAAHSRLRLRAHARSAMRVSTSCSVRAALALACLRFRACSCECMLAYLAPRGYFFYCSLRSRVICCAFALALASSCSQCDAGKHFVLCASCARAPRAAHSHAVVRACARGAMRVSTSCSARASHSHT